MEKIKLPRKRKKLLLGRKINKRVLRQILDSVVIVQSSKTMFETPIVKPYLFCPRCGCRHFKGTGNMTSYPEHWEKFHCLRCWSIVGYIDNSPFIHALECKESNYDPIF